MALGLSSNWKKFQAQTKAESSSPTASTLPGNSAGSKKRKAPPLKNDEDTKLAASHQKRQKVLHPQKATQPKSIKDKPTKPKGKEKEKTRPNVKMGGAQSSQTSSTHPEHGIAPSIQLWTSSTKKVTSEALAEAYSLGLSPQSLNETPSFPNAGLSLTPDSAPPGKYISLDCEMVGIGPGGITSILARVSLVDFHGRQIYDSFVRPRPGEIVTDWRTQWSGVSARDMATAREFSEVQTVVAGLLRDRVLVGHDVKHDLAVLVLTHPARMIRDTSKLSIFKKYGNGPKPKLRVLAQELLGLEIQQGQHSSIEDARVAMMLFRKHKSAFDMEVANKFSDTTQPVQKGGGKQSGKKKKGKK